LVFDGAPSPPPDEPDALRFFGFLPQAGLSAGGTVVTVEGSGITETVELVIGDAATARLDWSETGLTAVTPPLAPGAHPVTLTDPAREMSVVHEDAFVSTADPFESGLDLTPGEMTAFPESPDGVTAVGGLFPVDEATGALLDLEHETPEGARIRVPAAALPQNALAAYLAVRSAADLETLHDGHPIEAPSGYGLRSPAADFHVLLQLPGEDGAVELVEAAEDAPMSLAFPVEDGARRLALGRMNTFLGLDFAPILPEDAPAPLEIYTEELDETEDGLREGEVLLPGTYGVLGADVFGDVTGDGQVTAVDVQIVINLALGRQAPDGVAFQDADLNGDGAVDAIDVQLVINAALGRT
jgi:hypothetical protein